MKTKLLSKEELRSIRGGKTATTPGFPCRVVDENGDEHIKITSTIEECLKFGGY